MASPYERRTHCIVILRVKLLLENTTLGHDQEEKYKDSQFKKSLEERVLKQTGYIGVATIRALSLAQCAAKKKKEKKNKNK